MRSTLAAAITAGIVALSAAPAGRSGSDAVTGTAANVPSPVRQLSAHRLGRRPGAVRVGTAVPSAELFPDRVFANDADGFALADLGNAQYPARSVDGGRRWRIAGPQVHVDAADGPEGVGYVGLAGPRTFFAYGSSVVDVSTNGGRTWWETFLGELAVAVVPGPRDDLIAFVQQPLDNHSTASAVTWQYVSRDGGRHWHYTSALGGG